ncbi:hypothetical protein LINGRAHAP2_LOCUS24302 [Linum grandiflorum]
MLIAKKNQLKKAYFFVSSPRSDSSNWSAPNDDTHGFIPPVPSAIKARAPYRNAVWPSVAFGHGRTLQGCGRRPSTEADKEKIMMVRNRPRYASARKAPRRVRT